MAKTKSMILGAATCGLCVAAAAVLVGLAGAARSKGSVPLKEAKLNIEHNAIDHDTGFQGFIDSEGWDHIEVLGPNGAVLRFEGRGALGALGLTELFFESVEPENADVPIDKLLKNLPAGKYTFKGREMINGESSGETIGAAWLTHDIPAGPELLWPAKGRAVPVEDLVIRWGAVTQSLKGAPMKIIAYQLIVEKDVAPHPHMIGKWGLSMYLPPTITSMAVPKGFLEPHTAYKWEVLAIEESGNQTLSSSEFKTE
jgi:hypothetical protein